MVQGTCWREGQEGRAEHSPREPLGCSKFHFPLGRDEWPRHYRYSQAPCTVTSASATYHTVKDVLNLNNVVFYYETDTNNVSAFTLFIIMRNC